MEIIEKPLVPTAKEAEELYALAHECGVYLMEAFAYLHSPWIAAIKNEVDSGAIGEICYIESQFLTSDYDMSNIRMRKETNGGALYDLGCYTTTMIGWMLGRQPDEIRAGAIFSKEGVDVLTSAVFSYKNGTKAMMNCGMVLETKADKRVDQLRIEGTAGSIRSTGEFNCCGAMKYTLIKNILLCFQQRMVRSNIFLPKTLLPGLVERALLLHLFHMLFYSFQRSSRSGF